MKYWIIEGNRQRLDGGSMFGNAPRALWERFFKADSQNRIELACRALLVQTKEGKNILFEAGIGVFFDPKLKERFGVDTNEHLLLKNLEKEGFKPEQIDAVVLSHLHFDHAGGLLTPYGKELELVFPNAKFYVGKEHWKRALKPHIREKMSFIPELHQLLEKSGRLVLVDTDSHSDLPFVKFNYVDGHTLGLMVAEIDLGDRTVFFVSDLVPGVSWVHLPIVMGYDRYPELTVNEKEELFKRVLEKDGILFFTHDPEVAFAKLVFEEGRYKPVSIN
jgi:glyoxylase-like metal-dependent hydrolase (beta-lactamase superfamily II)